MKIGIYEVDNDLVLQYCRIIKLLEEQFSCELERLRTQVHDKIFVQAGCNRSCTTRDDRNFYMALEKTCRDLLFVPDKGEITRLITPNKGMLE